jgi:hypothetical protein
MVAAARRTLVEVAVDEDDIRTEAFSTPTAISTIKVTRLDLL